MTSTYNESRWDFQDFGNHKIIEILHVLWDLIKCCPCKYKTFCDEQNGGNCIAVVLQFLLASNAGVNQFYSYIVDEKIQEFIKQVLKELDREILVQGDNYGK
jgi:uncharacterized protein YpbB